MRQRYGVLGGFLFAASLLLGVGGCGSSGGDNPGVRYTGKTVNATITQSNAAEIMAGFYLNRSAGEANSAGLLKNAPNALQNKPFFMSVYTGAISVIHHSDSPGGSREKTAGKQLMEIVTEEETLPSTCSGVTGEAVLTTETNDQTGDFSGTATFDDYCDTEDTLGMIYSGTMRFSGSGDGSSEEVSFTDLSVSDGFVSVGLDGEISIQYPDVSTYPDASTMEMDMDLIIVDEEAQKTYWFNNFHLSGTDLSDGYGFITEIEMSGNFYDSDYGYVKIETPEPLVFFSSGTGFPESGVLSATGTEGSSGGSAMAKLTAYSDTQYRLKADTDGDGVFEFYTGLLLWDDLSID